MSTNNPMIYTPDEYFKQGFHLIEENIIKFRDHYRNLSNVSCFDGHTIDETCVLKAAQELRIKADSDDYRKILIESVKSDDQEVVFMCLQTLIDSFTKQLSSHPPSISISTADIAETILTKINCVLIIKFNDKDVRKFFDEFLLPNVNEISTSKSSSNDLSLSDKNELFKLNSESILALFLYEQLNSLGPIRQHQLERFRPVETINITDEFGTWSYDHFRGLFDIELSPSDENFFPTCWLLANNADINCKFVSIGTQQITQTTTSSTFDRSHTKSLQQFVEDLCVSQSNMKARKWLNAMEYEDIDTLNDLSNLKQTEWDQIKVLSVNAKKKFKAAVDRRRHLIEDSNNKKCTISSEKPINASHSEFLANLHLIKLFIYYTLRFNKKIPKHSTPAKLDGICINTSFVEIQDEGYVDDGRFPSMREFFLPLTISEKDLTMKRSNEITQKQRDQHKQLIEEKKHLKELSNERKKYKTDLKQSINRFQQDMKQAEKNPEYKEYQDYYKFLSEGWDQLNNLITQCNEQIYTCQTKISNIEMELNQSQKPIDNGLVKSERGIILYGPPGTGKSEITSKLSSKLGIVTVAPPMAAGELNRPLVGQSEKVILALASRCHRIPYAMCCLLIDEIDSLAPKRNEHSSEGKVDKMSILLSIIDGIKDVPNLMIFCSTNRLHMIDDAFLRRMSGKFFIGRPSSQARTQILAQIPIRVLERDLIERLAIASTNFSGAACKAFTRAITVHCLDVRREQPDFHVNYKQALEIADRIAQQHQIFLGSETLPGLLLCNLMNESTVNIKHLSRQMYTGRIVVDLHGGSARIEIIETDGRLALVEHELSSNEINVLSLLERLTSYGKDRNVQLLQLIDHNLLASYGAYNEQKVFETLKERYDECVAYRRSMIIYDLDALVGINKSESDSSMGRSISSSIVHQSVYTYICARFREATVEQEEEDNDREKQTVEKWAIVIIQDPFLLRQFTSKMKCIPTKQEEKEFEIERRKAEDLIKCVKCTDYYIENENKMGNCHHHDGFICDNLAPDLTIRTASQVADILNELEFNIMNYPAEREKFERQKNRFKWICCNETVTTGSRKGGCKSGKHGIPSDIEDENRGDRCYLDSEAVERWEKECQNNPEYNQKRMKLLKERSSVKATLIEMSNSIQTGIYPLINKFVSARNIIYVSIIIILLFVAYYYFSFLFSVFKGFWSWKFFLLCIFLYIIAQFQ